MCRRDTNSDQLLEENEAPLNSYSRECGCGVHRPRWRARHAACPRPEVVVNVKGFSARGSVSCSAWAVFPEIRIAHGCGARRRPRLQGWPCQRLRGQRLMLSLFVMLVPGSLGRLSQCGPRWEEEQQVPRKHTTASALAHPPTSLPSCSTTELCTLACLWCVEGLGLNAALEAADLSCRALSSRFRPSPS